MNTLHHPHLTSTDIDATIVFWRAGFGGHVVADVQFRRRAQRSSCASDRAPAPLRPATPQHRSRHRPSPRRADDELDQLFARLRGMGVSVTNVRHLPGAANAMAQGPDGLLVDLFPADLDDLAPALRDHFDNTT